MVDLTGAATSTTSATTSHGRDTRILIRATRLDARVLTLADELAAASGHPVSFIVDERNGPADAHGRSIVGVTDKRCRRLGLFLPSDYAWRCGDYGYYLARQQFPEARFLWMIEYDVRFDGDTLADFFRFFERQTDVDFLATGLEPAEWDWFWAPMCLARNARAYRCLFAITRLSTRAIDALLDKRRAHSRRLARRGLWPNDEAMVATTLMNGDFVCRDFNDFGATYYDPANVTFVNPIDGDRLVRRPGETRLLHPVLYGQAYTDKMARLKVVHPPPTSREYWTRRVFKKLNRESDW